MKTARLAMSARHTVRGMAGKFRRIKKKTYTWKSIPAQKRRSELFAVSASTVF